VVSIQRLLLLLMPGRAARTVASDHIPGRSHATAYWRSNLQH
jgi:hypothetical protein